MLRWVLPVALASLTLLLAGCSGLRVQPLNPREVPAIHQSIRGESD